MLIDQINRNHMEAPKLSLPDIEAIGSIGSIKIIRVVYK
jgi:hypothetical protein